jgi:hypothetical protein
MTNDPALAGSLFALLAKTTGSKFGLPAAFEASRANTSLAIAAPPTLLEQPKSDNSTSGRNLKHRKPAPLIEKLARPPPRKSMRE